ncbi:MAG: hypothetical protein ACKOI3_01780 [Actinomycetota bacterium]
MRPPIALSERGGLRDDIQRLSLLLVAELETLIRRAPEQWHLFSPMSSEPTDFSLLRVDNL